MSMPTPFAGSRNYPNATRTGFSSMANVNATGRRKGEPKHVRQYEWMLACPAYRSLSCPARCLLVELGRRYNGHNNGNIPLSVREAANLLGTGKNQAMRAFRDLEDRGFIRPHIKGAFTLKARHATTWILAEFGYRGERPSKDFMKWKPG